MTQDEVTAFIQEATRDHLDCVNLHGITQRKTLVTPQKRKYWVGVEKKTLWDFWLVLEEDPIAHTGYMILFDEEEQDFCLAVRSKEGPDCYIGFYGDFITTFLAM